jgi:uncharacterized membrane-anchored protein YitT (DUF2179 family)
MPQRSGQSAVRFLSRAIWNLGLITLGSVLCAVAVNGILIPQGFVSGGVTGLALVIHYLLPSLPVSGLYFFLNIPLFAFGWIFVGRRFFLYSIAGMVIFSSALQWVQVPVAVQDPILSALLAGIISGAGSGIILRSVGSAGGTDILSVILLNRFSVRVGTTVLAFNSGVLIAAAVFSSLQSALYTLVYLYVSSHILNLVITGLSQRKAIFIISPHWEEISREILREIRRGVTIIRGQGGYSGRDEQILYTIITFRDLPRLKRMIRRVDPGAFVVVTDTMEVMGHRIGNQPHW